MVSGLSTGHKFLRKASFFLALSLILDELKWLGSKQQLTCRQVEPSRGQW